ncbi:MAG: polysaccharide deacetylase family protein [Pseudoxanthomonas sp.]|jgi:peptidoglycan/xylan/chitin deacetylase (PgdA/CDA1 family)|uniref:polysaccharide deacetylase family protein n=1 Tax=Pseudoxanthomonas TaxID=83618 RepID=UPI00192F0A15|nr:MULTISPECIES: polysaccharide deacetylase family protein [Pseudoxanthomonas]MCH2090470.1 polysaccharide deacetylase family protein [Pseudoxanthomonas sp.]
MNPRPRRLRVLRFLPNGWLMTSGPTDAARNLYLTFDDGPHPDHTPALLDLLAEHGAKASFFLVGREVERHDALARRIASEGHTLGNHSYSHPRFEALTLDEQLEEVERTQRLLTGIDGRSRHAFRPPRGVLTGAMLASLVRRRHRIDYWSYDSLDYSRRPVPELLETIQRHPPRGGDIILMHDDSEHSLTLLRALIPEWIAQGFSLRALPHVR